MRYSRSILTIGVLFSLPGFALPAFAQQTWTRTYGGPNPDYGQSVQQTSDSGYIVAGSTASYGNGFYDVWLVKTDASGDTLWTKTYGGTGEEQGYSVQQTSDGGYIVAGRTMSYGNGSYDVYLIKTDTSGDTLWTRTYGGTGWEEDYSVRQTSDGGYIVAGTTMSYGSGNWDVYLIKTNASGDTLWTRTYGGTSGDIGYSVQQTSDSGYIVAGYTQSFGNGYEDVWLIKTNASGDSLWTRTYGGTSNDVGNSVQQTSDGGYIVAGTTGSYGHGSYDVYLIKTNASGDTLWTRTYGGTNYEEGRSVQQTSDGGYIITGWTGSYGHGNYDVYLFKTNASGDTLWTRTYGGTNLDEGFSVQQTSDGGYIVTGNTTSFGAGAEDAYLIKTDASGNVGIDEPLPRHPANSVRFLVQPNPFASFTRVPGHEADVFVLSDITGRQVAVSKGDRVGEGLRPGVYFLSPATAVDHSSVRPLRIVKAK